MFELRYRVRTWAGSTPLPQLDVRTNCLRIAMEECDATAQIHGWDNVSLTEQGERPLKGDPLRERVVLWRSNQANV